MSKGCAICRSFTKDELYLCQRHEDERGRGGGGGGVSKGR
jgi:hypothetical protein